MKLCGIELKGNDAVLVILDITGERATHIDIPTRKIALGDSDNAAQVAVFKDTIERFFKANGITEALIKKRAKKGKFAGGPDTFKMEALIQIVPDVEVTLISPQALAAMEKKNDIALPATLNKYQHVAYLAGIYGTK